MRIKQSKYTVAILVILATILLLPVYMYLALEIPWVQTLISRKITVAASQSLNTTVKLDKVTYSISNELILKNFYVEDYRYDTLAYAKKVKLRFFAVFKNKIFVDKITLDNFKLKIVEDSTGYSNLQYFLDHLPPQAPKESTGKKSNFGIKINTLELKKWDLSYTTEGISNDSAQFDPKNFRIYPLNLTIKKIEVNDTIQKFNLKKLYFKDKSGFTVNDAKFKFSLTPHALTLDDIYVGLEKTKIDIPKFELQFDSLAQLQKPEDLQLEMITDTSTTIHAQDIAYFVPQLKGSDIYFKTGSYIYGTLADLHILPLEIYFPKKTKLVANIDLLGLPDIEHTYIDMQIDTLDIYLTDLLNIKKPDGQSYLKLPKQMYSLRFIHLKSRFTGLLNDMNINMSLKSNMGTIKSDFAIKRDSIIYVEGLFDTKDLDLGNLSQNSLLGKITFTDSLKLYIKDKNFWGYNDTKISQFQFNDYTYSNTRIKGEFTNKSFSGDIQINDSNLVYSFSGVLEMQGKKSIGKFVMSLDKANLYALNFDKEDPNSFISFGVKADLEGTNIEDVVGTLEFNKPLVYVRYMEKIQVNDFKLSSYITQYIAGKPFKEVILRSDIVDGSIQGILESSSLANYFKNLTAYFFPSLPKQKPKLQELFYMDQNTIGSNFRFMFNIKNTEKITRIFAPQVSLAPHSMILGEFMALSKNFYTEIKSDSLKINDNKLIGLTFRLDTKEDTLKLKFNSRLINLGVINFENFAMEFKGKNDTLKSLIKWNNTTSDTTNSGELNFLTTLARVDTTLKLKTEFYQDSLFINGVKWVIKKLNLSSEGKTIAINSHFEAPEESQHIGIIGKISPNPKDKLLVRIQNLDISQLNAVIPHIKLKGHLTGNTTVSNLKDKPVVISDNIVQAFNVNDVDLKTLAFASRLEGESNILKFKIFTEKAINNLNLQNLFLSDTTGEKYIEILGSYNLDNKDYQVNLDFKKFKLKALYPYFEKYISGISRFATLQGKVAVSGNKDRFSILGDLGISNATFRTRQTNVTYTINQMLKVHMNNRQIIIDTTSIVVQGGSGHGKFWGIINHNDFKDFDTKIYFRPDTFMVLNIPYSDTAKYYGQAFISGDVAFLGTGPSSTIEANIRTESNTDVTIMMNTPKTSLQTSDFYHFITHDSINDSLSQIELMIQDKIPKNKPKGSLDLNVNLQITPESKYKIVMDPQTGEQLEIQGHGNINIQLNPYGGLILFGTVAIDKGYYLLSIENIITKKFSLKPGSTIKWNGSPTDADLDLTAVYTVKGVNLYDLVLDDNYWNERTTVNCDINLRGKLTEPQISFDLDLPKADQRIVSQVTNLDESEKTKQVLSLLILGRFQPLPGLVFDPNALSGKMSASDVLSSQLSHWLSNIDENLELNVNYQTAQTQTDQQETALPRDQFEVALSYRLWNERVIINTDVGVGGQSGVPQNNSTNPNQIIGDVEVEVKLNKKGNIRFKAFNRTNRNEFYDKGPYTQGVGLFFQKDFNTLFPKAKHKKDSVRTKDTKNKQQ